MMLRLITTSFAVMSSLLFSISSFESPQCTKKMIAWISLTLSPAKIRPQVSKPDAFFSTTPYTESVRLIDRSELNLLLTGLFWSVAMKKNIPWKVKLSIYWSIYVPTLHSGQAIWIMDHDWTRSWVEVTKRSSIIQVELWIKFLYIT